MKPGNAISLIETAYRLDYSTEQWLGHLAAMSAEALDSRQGAMAFQYDASSGHWIHSGVPALHGLSPEFARDFFNQPDAPPEVAQELAKAFMSVRFESARAVLERAGALSLVGPVLDRYGIDDLIGINGVDPSGRGCFSAVATSPRKFSGRTIQLWHRLAAHIAAGNRLRTTLEKLTADGTDAANRAEAVLTPNGKVEHATGPAEPRSSRDALRDALVRIDKARAERDDAERSVDLWRGLVAGRWSLVEHFERDGRRYFLAHKNDPALAHDRALTVREKQVLGYAELGHSNKLIAYELGLSSSTVSSLLAKARRKLGK